MELSGSNGNRLSLRISGYQFPHAEDPRKRFSWHMISGSVICGEGVWTFDWQALTCDESGRVSSWLRAVASSSDEPSTPGYLAFTEPNLRFDAVVSVDEVIVSVSFDLEFRPPWRTWRGAGDPYRVELPVARDQLVAAAAAWDADLADFPDWPFVALDERGPH